MCPQRSRVPRQVLPGALDPQPHPAGAFASLCRIGSASLTFFCSILLCTWCFRASLCVFVFVRASQLCFRLVLGFRSWCRFFFARDFSQWHSFEQSDHEYQFSAGRRSKQQPTTSVATKTRARRTLNLGFGFSVRA